MIALLVVGGLVGAYLLLFNKPAANKLRAAVAPQVAAVAAAIDPDTEAKAYAAKIKAEALGRIIAYEDLAKHAELMGRVAEALDPNAASGGTPSNQTPAPQ